MTKTSKSSLVKRIKSLRKNKVYPKKNWLGWLMFLTIPLLTLKRA